MNIIKDMNFKSDKPNVKIILRSDHLKVVAIGLGKNVELKQHKTSVSTLLTVLKGKINFYINDEVIVLNKFETFSIPVEVIHHVFGIKSKNLFTLTQEIENK
jgi:quercetin dioxygenase-like cupin family protein